jgi:hypothetical protein
MRSIIMALAVASLVASPVSARDWRQAGHDFRPSAFAGARLKLPLGSAKAEPSAQLTVAPARSSISGAGMMTTRIGEGVGLEFAGKKPQLTIAGATNADIREARQKMGISTVGWVAIGVGAAAVVTFGILVATAGCDSLFNDEVCDE